MRIPEDDKQEAARQKEEREFLDKVKRALALLEIKPNYPKVRVLIHRREKRLRKHMPEEAKKPLTEARLQYVIELLEARAGAYVELVNDIDSQKAFAAIIDDMFRKAWFEFSTMSIYDIPWSAAEAHRHPWQVQADKIYAVCMEWVTEGFKRLDSLRKTDTAPKQKTRRGYRLEIRSWMAKKGIGSVREAAKRLAVSESTLKSIMASKGKVKYSEETLSSVLSGISHTDQVVTIEQGHR